jgi:hypothetical protein
VTHERALGAREAYRIGGETGKGELGMKRRKEKKSKR